MRTQNAMLKGPFWSCLMIKAVSSHKQPIGQLYSSLVQDWPPACLRDCFPRRYLFTASKLSEDLEGVHNSPNPFAWRSDTRITYGNVSWSLLTGLAFYSLSQLPWTNPTEPHILCPPQTSQEGPWQYVYTQQTARSKITLYWPTSSSPLLTDNIMDLFCCDYGAIYLSARHSNMAP